MREIKFRGRERESNKWVFGYARHWKCCYGDEWHIQGKNDNVHIVIPETIGQFTGLRDADGREIYEGDVLGASKTTVLVEWGVDGWVADCFTLLEWLKLHESHVIGNIYDSPELLEANHERD